MRKCSEGMINRVFLMMGGACNFKCRYCLQDKNMPREIPRLEPSEEVYRYLEHLIKIRPSCMERKLKLMFWGGEPLLYIRTIKKVIERLGDKVDYTIVTNGSLMTWELVEYLNEHDVEVVISNDGFMTPYTRGQNVLADGELRAMFWDIKKLAVESVTSQYNYDYIHLFKYIDNMLGIDGRKIVVSVDRLRVTWDMPEDIYDIPLDDYENKLRQTAGQALIDMIEMNTDSNAWRMFQPYIYCILENIPIEVPMCGSFYNSMNIDCLGNIYVCHNSSEIIGHIGEERGFIAQRFEEWTKKHICQTPCEYGGVCRLGCPLEDKYREKSCKINKIFWQVCLDLTQAFLNNFESIDWSVGENEC